MAGVQSVRTYVRGLNIFKDNFITILQLFIYDLGFVLSVLLFAQLMSFLMPNTDTGLRALLQNTVGVGAFLLFYIIIIIALYSVFKLLVINTARTMLHKERILWQQYPAFLLLNILLIVGMGLLWIMLSWIQQGLKAELQSYGSVLFFLIFLYASYVVTQESHIAFARTKKLFSACGQGLGQIMHLKERAPLWWSCFFLIVYGGITMLLGSFIGWFIDTPYRYSFITSISQPIFVIVTALVFYGIFSLCRYHLFAQGWKD